MPRRPSPRSRSHSPSQPQSSTSAGPTAASPPPDPPPTQSPGADGVLPTPSVRRVGLFAALMLLVHFALCVNSLIVENATVDEALHLPAGVAYWRTGEFRIYHHNPPLIKLIAALPVVASGPNVDPLFQRAGWAISQADFGHRFASLNAERIFDLFTKARLVMPLFSLLGGATVFLWSRRLYGDWGGLLSLGLWCLCPNILAHGRLITTDVGASAIVAASTLGFWLSLRRPSAGSAAFAGLGLGLALLSKFSAILLLGLWPAIWLLQTAGRGRFAAVKRAWRRSFRLGAITIVIALTVVNLGYLLEGTGQPLGRFEFLSGALTKPRGPEHGRPPLSHIADLQPVFNHRVNRFRGTWLESVPVPLPREFVLGFDEQKLESEGIPKSFFDPTAPTGEVTGYPVYLDGQLRDTGWKDYYLRAFLYKTPESALLLIALTLVLPLTSRRLRTALDGPNEWTLMAPPLAIIAAMTFGTDINIGLRYILPLFPYLYILCGKLAIWAQGRRWAIAILGAAMAWSAWETASIHPSYLAYFNRGSGGPDRGSEHLIDSNLDWGQDLVKLQSWAATHAKGERIGLAYFGQIHPNLLASRGEGLGLNWFLPPARPGTCAKISNRSLQGPAPRLEPGYYAISASLVRGLPWRLYDPSPDSIFPAWSASKHAFSYFTETQPIERIGHSIFIYRITEKDIESLSWDRLAP